MKLSVDGHGRIVIPKMVRESLGLYEGSKLDLELSDGKIELTPVDETTAKWEDGLLFLGGEIDPSFDYNELLDKIRMRTDS